jgi:hypothetical protein
MATFDFNGKTFYIDGRLKAALDKKVIPSLKYKDEDCVFIVDGEERAGKSVFSMLISAYVASQLKTKFTLVNVCLSPEEFRNEIMNADKNSAVNYDEAHRGMASARSLSEVNNILKDLMMEMGQRNLFVLVVIPSFFLLDRYAAIFRAKGLFHIYKRKGKRGFWCFFNRKYKLKLYQKGKKDLNYNCMRWPYFRGRFLDQYTINEVEYRKKKAGSFQEKKRITKAEVWIAQRNKLIYLLHKEYGLGEPSITKLCKKYNIPLQHSQIGEILANLRDMSEDIAPTPAL